MFYFHSMFSQTTKGPSTFILTMRRFTTSIPLVHAIFKHHEFYSLWSIATNYVVVHDVIVLKYLNKLCLVLLVGNESIRKNFKRFYFCESLRQCEPGCRVYSMYFFCYYELNDSFQRTFADTRCASCQLWRGLQWREFCVTFLVSCPSPRPKGTV